MYCIKFTYSKVTSSHTNHIPINLIPKQRKDYSQCFVTADLFGNTERKYKLSIYSSDQITSWLMAWEEEAS